MQQRPVTLALFELTKVPAWCINRWNTDYQKGDIGYVKSDGCFVNITPNRRPCGGFDIAPSYLRFIKYYTCPPNENLRMLYNDIATTLKK